MRCLSRFGAISTLKGLQYWSVTEGGWRMLITQATALDGPDLGYPRANFTLAEMRSGKELFFAQKDHRAAGDVIYRMQVREMSPTRLVVAIENVSPVKRFMLTLFNAGDLQSLHFLERLGPNVWSYYGLAWAGETTSSSRRSRQSATLIGISRGAGLGAARFVQPRKVLIGQVDIDRGDILFEMGDLARARDGKHHRGCASAPRRARSGSARAMRLGDPIEDRA